MPIDSFGTDPLDETIDPPDAGSILFISDQTNGQGEAILHEIIDNGNAVYNNPRHSRPVLEDLFQRSRYVTGSLPAIRANADELTISCQSYDVAVFDAFQSGAGAANNSSGILTALRQNLVEAGAIGILRDGRHALEERPVIADFADIIITLSEHRVDGKLEYRFSIVKNRYDSPQEKERPLEFGPTVKIDTTRQLS